MTHRRRGVLGFVRILRPRAWAGFLAFGMMASAAGAVGWTEPPGPCSRRTPLAISEFMISPASQSDDRRFEFVELYNSQPWAQDIGGYRLTGAVDFTFPPGARLAGQSFAVVVGGAGGLPAALSSATNVFGPLSGHLPAESGTIRLRHPSGAILLEVKYSDQPPWPVAVGAGHSLVLTRASLGEGDPRAWSASTRIGGSPGTAEPADDDPSQGVVINEFQADFGTGGTGFVELFNPRAQPLDVSGAILTDDPTLNRVVLPAGSTLGPGGFLTIPVGSLGFAPARPGGSIYLLNRDRKRVLDAVRFGPPSEGVANGRFPNGSELVRPLAQATPGRPNEALRPAEIVLNEIMYDPLSGDDDDEYVEVHNPGSRAVDLSGWRLGDGIEFEIPTGTVLPGRGYLVIARNVARLLASHPQLTPANAIGNFRGTLANGGERVTLTRADGVVVEEVVYRSGGRWGSWAHGGGSSLERLDARADPGLPTSWADSDESAKAPWTTVEFTGPLTSYEYPFNYALNQLHLILLGRGECLIDQVEVLRSGQGNLVTNGTFQGGLVGWTGQGNHVRVDLASPGYDDDTCLRLRASDRGNPGPDRLLAKLNPGLKLNETVTLRARVRWLHGCPEILVRLVNNYLEVYGRLNVPANLGTPGQPNSRSGAQIGPGIAEVSHRPVLPADGEAITVSARVQDPDGVGAVTLRHRRDPDTKWQDVPMRDDGTAGDAVPGDGIFEGTIPGAAPGTMIAFYVLAVDQGSPTAEARFPDDAPARECLVRVGETRDAFQLGDYRLWMSRRTLDTWRTREPASDEPLDITFASGGSRVIYNVGATFAGSKYASYFIDSPIGKPCDYSLFFPEDDRWLGATDVRLSVPGLVVDGDLDSTLQSEQAAFWLAEQMGLPSAHRRYCRVFVNGVRRGQVMEDAQKPNRDFVEQWFPADPDGELYKLQFHIEVDPLGRNGVAAPARALTEWNIRSNTPPETPYRWVWNKRSVRGSNNDFRGVLELLHAFNRKDPESYTAEVTGRIDADQWMRTLAVERAVGNWDAFGCANDQNMFFYQPPGGRWQLMIWDMDFPMDGTHRWASGESIFSHTGRDGGGVGVSAPEQRFLRHPPFCRSYLRALDEVMNGPVQRVGPWLDARAAGLAGSGVSAVSPQGIKNYLAARTTSIRRQLEAFRVPFRLTSPAALETSLPSVELTGTASYEIETIRADGARLPVVWTTVTNWVLTLPVTASTHRWILTGHDPAGQPLPDAPTVVSVTLTGGTPRIEPALILNEWMASNTRTLAEPSTGRFEDWFEIYNPGPTTVDLLGYRLSDDPANPAKFVIPKGWMIPPQGHLLVWADEETHRNLTHTNRHVNFKLSRDGERLALYRPDGSVADAVEFGPQANDVSQGRWPSGAAGTMVEFVAPTPGSVNVRGDLVLPLGIRRSPDGQPDDLVLTWQALPGSRYRLQGVAGLSADGWRDISNGDGPNRLLVPREGATGFFRLVRD